MKQELRRRQILDCAKTVFSEKGYYDTQVEDIIKLARIGKGTIYEYFRSKEDVFLSLLERFLAEWEAAAAIDMESVMGRKPYTHPAVNYVHAVVMKTLKFFAADIERANIILRLGPGLNLNIEEYLLRFERKVVQLIVDGLTMGQRFGHIDAAADTEAMANFLLGGVQRTAYNYLILEKHEFSGPAVEKLVADTVKIIRGGIFSFVYREK